MAIKPEYDDGTPQYNPAVIASYRNLQVRECTYLSPPGSGRGVRLGLYQAQVFCGKGAAERNVGKLAEVAKLAAGRGVQLLSFPELYIQGYTQSLDTAKATAVSLDSPTIQQCQTTAEANNIGLIIGYGEHAEVWGKTHYFDSIVVIDQDGTVLLNYRKMQLYAQQERDDWSFGMDAPSVFKINNFAVGVLNCYENEFPELSRILALQGAKLIVGPTAADGYYHLAKSGERSMVPYPDCAALLFPAFAFCNNLFYAYNDRCGYEERDGQQWHYRGNSLVAGPHGDILVAAENERDTLLIADCIPEYYGMTHPEPEYSYLRDRRPDMYKMLLDKTVRFQEGGYSYADYKDGEEIGKR